MSTIFVKIISKVQKCQSSLHFAWPATGGRRGAPPKPRAAYGKRVRSARRRPAAEGGVLNITAAVWTAGFHWWRSGNKKWTQNVSEYMLVLALCLIIKLYLTANIKGVTVFQNKELSHQTHGGNSVKS